MERFDLNDFQRKIEELEKERESFNQQIDAKIGGLRIAESIFSKDEAVISSEYRNMSIREVIFAILGENRGIKSEELINIARKGGAEATEDSFRSVLSKLLKGKEIRARKRKGGGYKYYLIENKENAVTNNVDYTDRQTIIGQVYANMNLMDACRLLLRNTDKKLLKEDMITILIEGGYDFKKTPPKRALHERLMSLRKNGEIGAEKINRRNYYYGIKKKGLGLF